MIHTLLGVGTSLLDFTDAFDDINATGVAAVGVGLGLFALLIGIRYGKKVFRAIAS